MKTAILILMLSAVAASADTLTTVSLTLWGEARSESYAGKYAVASTIWNRADGKPSRLAAVCLDRKQYSCWRKRKFTQTLPDLRKPLDRTAWRDCVTLATLMMDGEFLPSLDSKHYHEASIRPYWSVNMKMLARVDSHKFYR
jgi:spore germination cell wall hydrolase CwlJ-like protein